MLGSNVVGQQLKEIDTYELVNNIAVKTTFLATDNLQNCYVVNTQNELKKYSANGELLFTFSINRYGKLSYVDAGNPLKLLLFYPEFGTIVVLDKTLSQVGTHKLFEKGFQGVTAVGITRDNNIWLYDAGDFKLKKINDQAAVIQESEPLNQILDFEVAVTQLVEKNDFIHLNCPQHGVVVFDVYGTYAETYHLPQIGYFQIIRDNVAFWNEEGIHLYSPRTTQQTSTALPLTKGVKHLSISGNRMYVATVTELRIFTH